MAEGGGVGPSDVPAVSMRDHEGDDNDLDRIHPVNPHTLGWGNGAGGDERSGSPRAGSPRARSPQQEAKFQVGLGAKASWVGLGGPKPRTIDPLFSRTGSHTRMTENGSEVAENEEQEEDEEENKDDLSHLSVPARLARTVSRHGLRRSAKTAHDGSANDNAPVNKRTFKLAAKQVQHAIFLTQTQLLEQAMRREILKSLNHEMLSTATNEGDHRTTMIKSMLSSDRTADEMIEFIYNRSLLQEEIKRQMLLEER